MVIKTLASVPAPSFTPVVTSTLYEAAMNNKLFMSDVLNQLWRRRGRVVKGSGLEIGSSLVQIIHPPTIVQLFDRVALIAKLVLAVFVYLFTGSTISTTVLSPD